MGTDFYTHHGSARSRPTGVFARNTGQSPTRSLLQRGRRDGEPVFCRFADRLLNMSFQHAFNTGFASQSVGRRVDLAESTDRAGAGLSYRERAQCNETQTRGAGGRSGCAAGYGRAQHSVRTPAARQLLGSCPAAMSSSV